MRFRVLAVISVIGAGLAGFMPPAAVAGGMDVKQIRIAAKVFNFLQKKPVPGAIVVVLTGAADVALLSAALHSLKINEGRVTDVASAVAVFVNSIDEANAVKSVNPQLLIIGSDAHCVDVSACIIAVETTPKISVYLSRVAASNAGIDFDTSFKMLVTER